MLIAEDFYRNGAVINAVISFIYIGQSAYADNFFYLIAAVKFFPIYLSITNLPGYLVMQTTVMLSAPPAFFAALISLSTHFEYPADFIISKSSSFEK